ncbi:OmpA family protein [Nonomuraea sp. NPDC046802]|uniref:OmpA family protein n=1 Tax=Nonomuraea sp. NPDC046802 TaxID=3154919 RepID=UPI0034106F8B
MLATTYATSSPSLKIDLVGLNRMAGKHLVVQLRLSNTASGGRISWPGVLRDNFRAFGSEPVASGIAVLDTAERRWLLPYKPADRQCLCTDKNRDGVDYFIDGGDSVTVYAVLPAPSGDPDTATIVTPIAPPLVNAPISDAAPVPPPGQEIPNPDDVEVSVVSHPFRASSESLDKSEESADDGENVEVSLSADVLFEVNKATLTGKAKAIITRTAELVDRSQGATVEVAGHADSSGTHAINDPLSRRRAQAVQRMLESLVTRDGIAYEAKGYGSRRPLYSNSTDEGKRRNRRVTLTFAKPLPASPAPVATTTPTPGADGMKATTREDGQDFALEVTGLRRLTGDLGVLTYKVTNEGGETAWYRPLGRGAEWMAYKYLAASNVELTDQQAGRKYVPGHVIVGQEWREGEYCACSDLAGARLGTTKFGPNVSKEFWGLFSLPSDGSSLTVKVATFSPLEVPIH